MARLPLVDSGALNAAQQQVYRQIAGGARGRVGYPFRLMLHSPPLAGRVEQIGAYLRFESPLPPAVREMAICVVASHWKSDVEWNSHSRQARALGVADAVLAAIAAGRRPTFDNEAEAVAFDYVNHVLGGTGLDSMPDGVFDAARRIFTEAGMVDLTGLVGYYTMLAMMMNTFGVLPDGAVAPWRGA